MKKILTVMAFAAMLFACCPKQAVIKTKVPPRPAGQQDMLLFAADPIEDVGKGIVGLGDRGSGAVSRLTYVPGSHNAAQTGFTTFPWLSTLWSTESTWPWKFPPQKPSRPAGTS